MIEALPANDIDPGVLDPGDDARRLELIPERAEVDPGKSKRLQDTGLFQDSEPSRLAVILGGGAALGAFEVGVIDSLARQGLRPDLIVGTSVGALNAAFWAFHQGPDVGERLLRAWLATERRSLISEQPWRWLRRLLTHQDHLLGHSGEMSLISRQISPEALIEEAGIPLVVVTTELGSGARIALREGNVRSALLAAIAIPGLFAPVPFDGRRLVDGSLVANCDLETAVEAGMQEAIVVDPFGMDIVEEGADVMAVIEHAVMVSLRHQTDLAIRALAGRMRIALLRPTLHWTARPFDFSHTLELFEMGQDAGRSTKGALRRINWTIK
jgi:NTE family protein